MGVRCKHYDFREIEQFWQNEWLRLKTFRADEDAEKSKYYILDMFPYPSGAGLHIGHPEGYTASDILARYKWANGFNVLHPMGWDAFGLPAEQHAIATGQHPAANTEKNIRRFREQIQSLGFAIDWDREIDTTSPEYYRWTQWIFLQLFRHGLAYIDNKPVWWCPELRSVLANEEIVNGRSERGNFPVERRNLRQWVLRITKYADKLLDGLKDIDWPDSTKRQQIAWIGRSEGAEINFEIIPDGKKICIYTTRPDTIYGVSFLVLSPEHPLVEEITTEENRKNVEKYITQAKSKSDLERTDLAKDKSGIFSGSYARNPLSGASVPIWIADYVLASYGTGAVMAVPAHDERDFEFARKFNLSVRQVIEPMNTSDNGTTFPFCSDGILINSGEFDGLVTPEAREKIVEKAEQLSVGHKSVKYKLRDWLFSRQRYWGEPIPILWIERKDYEAALNSGHAYFAKNIPEVPICYVRDGVEVCAIPLSEADLPSKLPEVVSYLPSDNGESPLSHAEDWLNVFVNLSTGEISTQPKEGSILARRETNTMPQWAGSCWYYLRYMSPKDSERLVDPDAESYWKNPDFYIGGAEHAVLHLLYARFWHLFLHDIGAIRASKEPFTRLFHQGIILGADGTKMSKSRGNVVNPDEVIQEYGADSLRLYEMFLGPLDAMKPWNGQGIEGVYRFLKKVWALYIDSDGRVKSFGEKTEPEIRELFDTVIKKVTIDIESLHFNTAISQMMIFVNTVSKKMINYTVAKQFLQLLSPFAPHITEELWHRLGEHFPIVKASWPCVNSQKTVCKSQKIVLQVNGKVRDELLVVAGTSAEQVEKLAMAREKFSAYIGGKNIAKKIYIPGKIFNCVVG